jgi:hypothetical protein
MQAARRVIGLLAGVFGAGAFCAHPAHAAPGDATRLEYARSARAAECPDRDALKSAVVKRLGYDPFFPAARQTIVVEITDADAGLRAQMRLVDEQGIIRGSRELSDKLENCGELVASLALAISIALDPSAALGADPAADAVAPPAPPPKKEATPSEPAPSLAPPVAAPEPAQKPKRRRDRRPGGSTAAYATESAIPVQVRASAFSSLGVAPALAFGTRLGGGFRSDWFELIAEVNDQFAASRTFSGGTAEASLLSGALAPCWARSWFAGCALFDVGSLRTVGRSVQSPLVQRSLYLALGARAEVAPVIVGHLRFLANVDLLKSLTPITLRLYGQDVWQTPWASLIASLGLELSFP